MDFLKLLRSLEEFLYEAMTWLVIYPRTLWRVIRYPHATSRRVEAEFEKPPEQRFANVLSPPLFLMLSVLAAHGLEVALHVALPSELNDVGRALLGNEELLLLYRSITFSVWPLTASVFLLSKKGVPIDRESLRKPFFAQCYLISPCAIAMSTAAVFIRMLRPGMILLGLGMFLVACIWYVLVQTRWLQDELGGGWGRAHWATLRILGIGLFVNSAVAFLLLSDLIVKPQHS